MRIHFLFLLKAVAGSDWKNVTSNRRVGHRPVRRIGGIGSWWRPSGGGAAWRRQRAAYIIRRISCPSGGIIVALQYLFLLSTCGSSVVSLWLLCDSTAMCEHCDAVQTLPKSSQKPRLLGGSSIAPRTQRFILHTPSRLFLWYWQQYFNK